MSRLAGPGGESSTSARARPPLRKAYVYNGFGSCAFVASILGYYRQAQFCFKVRVGMDGVDDFWARITTGRREGSDGIVQNSSQVYPNALRRYITDGSDSHLGETGSDKVKERLKVSLRQEFGAVIHP